MRNLTKLAAAAAFCLASPMAHAGDGCDAGESVIKFTHVTAVKGHPKGEAAEDLRQRVNKALDGRYCMEVHPNSELYADDDKMFQAMLDGEIQMAAPSIAKMSGISPQYQVFDLPFMFRDLEHVIDFQYTPQGEALLNAGRKQGFLGLAYWMNGMRQISANRPLLKPEDVRGLKFRIQGSPVEKAYYDLLGGVPVKLAFAKVHDALASGEVDGQENTWSNIYTKKFYEEQDSVTETNHSVIAYIVVTSAKWFDKLPKDVRATLSEILLEVTHERNRFAFQLDELNRQKVIDNGGRINALTEAQRAEWQKTLAPVWAHFESEIGADLIDAAHGTPVPSL